MVKVDKCRSIIISVFFVSLGITLFLIAILNIAEDVCGSNVFKNGVCVDQHKLECSEGCEKLGMQYFRHEFWDSPLDRCNDCFCVKNNTVMQIW